MQVEISAFLCYTIKQGGVMNNLFDKEVLKYLKLYIQGNLEYRDKIIIKSIAFVKSYVQDKFASFINQNVMLSYDDLL